MNNKAMNAIIEQLGTINPAKTTESTLLSQERISYWKPEARLVPYALSCLETVLISSESALHDYNYNIVEEWASPRYERLFYEMANYIIREVKKGKSNSEMISQLPIFLHKAEKYTKAEARAIVQARVGDFIEKHFNSEKAQKYGHLDIMRDKAWLLGRLIIFRSLNNHAGFNLAEYEKWQDKEVEFAMSTRKFTTRKARDARKRMRLNGFDLYHNDTLRRWAEIWYLARVNPGKLPDAAETLSRGDYPDLVINTETYSVRYIQENIREYDIATGRFTH